MDTEKASNSTGVLKPSPEGGNAKSRHLRPSWLTEIISFVLCTTSPLVVIYYWIAYHYFDTSIVTAARVAYSEGPFQFFATRLPHSSTNAILGYAAWLALQAILYIYLPGSEALGPVTPAGRRLKYKLNGLVAWGATVALWAVGAVSGIIDPACIAKNWEGLVWITNAFSVVTVGGELHPRIGKTWDWRHDLSFAAYQYQSHGYMTNTMAAVVIMRAFVVVDFFVNELWFFHTLDGMYESFGFYNIYGFSAMMPVLWSLQTQYLVKHPEELSNIALIGVILLFTVGWLIRFSVDYQKVKFRQTGGECQIWGKPAERIRASHQTADGKTRHSLLLCSGWWGLARHANYTGSVMYTLALCAACGCGGIFPYTEVIMAGGMVIHRCYRDEVKCAAKYGKHWDEYCRQVRWRMIPGIY
ncbi:ergosterol biosynthesis ERG4/ERG24 family-domain-containing protein [Aspergillus pseudocaelatus]|uniref:7-dehydrocholesterol reductase n=1 Tax=Aspergillus pseudocaelatus TaxID=1825620 RepID=A0ABQ6WN73_9EURO|nr:ergosterol biosynthesis ERG4/ERG24 family-domain-containing protein [Aspergillus pseudocaelatus]